MSACGRACATFEISRTVIKREGESLHSTVVKSWGPGSRLPGFEVSPIIDYPCDPGHNVTYLCLSFFTCEMGHISWDCEDWESSYAEDLRSVLGARTKVWGSFSCDDAEEDRPVSEAPSRGCSCWALYGDHKHIWWSSPQKGPWALLWCLPLKGLLSVAAFFFISLFIYLLLWLHQVLVAARVILSCSAEILSCSMWDLVPWPGTEPRPPELGVHSLSHWTTREGPFFPSTLIHWPLVLCLAQEGEWTETLSWNGNNDSLFLF